MKIGIIGGGSLGLLWATRLAEYVDVTLLCKTYQQAKVIQQEGILLTTLDGQKKKYHVSAEWMDQSDNSADFDVLFLMVKQPSLPQVLPFIPSLVHKRTHIVAWQNGLGHIEQMAKFHFPYCYAVVTTEGARKHSINHVQHTGNGYVRLGSVASTEMTDPLFSLFLQRFGIKVVTDIEQVMWNKFAINCVINALTALLEVPNGKLMELGLHTTIKQLITEIVYVAQARGLQMSHDDIYYQVTDVCLKTTKNYSSMLQDILAKKPTEIDSLNGIVVSYAEQYGIKVPTNTFLTEMITAKSMLI